MTPKLVACDLDGTLLRTDRTVSARTVAILDELQDRNIPFVIVTGRPTRWLHMVIEQTGPRGPVVCSNGAMVYDPVTAEIIAEWPLDSDTLNTVMQRLRKAVPEIAFAVEHGEDMLREGAYPTPWDDEIGS